MAAVNYESSNDNRAGNRSTRPDQELLNVLTDWVGKLKSAKDSNVDSTSSVPSLATLPLPRQSTYEPEQAKSSKASSRNKLAASSTQLPTIVEKKVAASSSAASNSRSSLSSVYSQNLAEPSKQTKLTTLLKRIGVILHENPDIIASFDISMRGRINDMLGPLELRTKLNSILGMNLSPHEISLLMNRFGTAGVSEDKVDVVEVLSWARSTYARTHHESQFKKEAEKTRKEVQRLMRRNHVLSKSERKRAMNEELEKKVELKLSLAAFSLINGNDKASDILEKTDGIITVEHFGSIIPKMELFLSKLEFGHLVSVYALGKSEPEKNHINFDMFRGTLIDLAKETVRAARQDKAVSQFKVALENGDIPADQSSGVSSAELLELISSFQDSLNASTNDDAEILHMHPHTASNVNINAKRYGGTEELEILSDDALSVNSHVDYKRVKFGDGVRNVGDGRKQIPLAPLQSPVRQLPPIESPQKSLPKPSVDSVVNWIADPLEMKPSPSTLSGKIKLAQLPVTAVRSPTKMNQLALADGTA